MMKKIAKAELEKHIELTISKVNEEQDWFVRQFDKKIIKDEFDNIIKVYEVFNEYIDNIAEVYYVVLEKVEVYE